MANAMRGLRIRASKKRKATHVDAIVEVPWDRGSIPRASNQKAEHSLSLFQFDLRTTQIEWLSRPVESAPAAEPS